MPNSSWMDYAFFANWSKLITTGTNFVSYRAIIETYALLATLSNSLHLSRFCQLEEHVFTYVTLIEKLNEIFDKNFVVIGIGNNTTSLTPWTQPIQVLQGDLLSSLAPSISCTELVYITSDREVVRLCTGAKGAC